MVAYLRFHLGRRPDTVRLAQPEVGELLHDSRTLGCLLHIHRKAAPVIEPAFDLGVVSPVRCAGLTHQNIAVPRAKLSLAQRGFSRPEVLRLKKILVAESVAEWAIAPLVEGQRSRRLIGWMRNLDCVLAVWPHFQEHMHPRFGRRSDLQ